MLERNKGIDILNKIGGASSYEEAVNTFETRMDREQLAKIKKIQSREILIKIANAIRMCDPDSIFINTGSESDRQHIRELALKNGEEEKLSLKGHTIHFDRKEEQGRIVDRTFYIVNEGEPLSSLGSKKSREEAYQEIKKHMTGIMKGKEMIIGFYMRGPVGSPVSNPAIQISSSAYVAHSADLLYRNRFDSFDHEYKKLGYCFLNLHSEGKNQIEDLANARVFMDRSFQTTFSFNCTYAGNTLLMKKGNHRFAVDRSVYEHCGEQLSEHMFITGIKGPGGRITWCVGAAPSGCGKTTTAMAGNTFVGDDLAQMWIDSAGSIRSINPEDGIFGIVADVNREGDPILMEVLRKTGHEVIWSNVCVDEKGVPHWTGNGEDHPTRGRNFQGPWEKGVKDANGKEIPISHPNARCTINSASLANFSDCADDPLGVETQIVTYSGRDSDTMPPLWATKDSDHGVTIGACIVSAATATEVGASGIKRQPWANAPFIPGALSDYMDAQLKFFGNKKIAKDKKPVMAGLNYFLTDQARGGTSPKLLGEKKDVKVWLAWLERFAHDEVKSLSTPIGHLPRYEDLNDLFSSLINKPYSKELYEKQFSLYIDNIVARLDLQHEAYQKEKNMPPRLFAILEEQKRGLLILKQKHGAIVTPAQLA